VPGGKGVPPDGTIDSGWRIHRLGEHARAPDRVPGPRDVAGQHAEEDALARGSLRWRIGPTGRFTVLIAGMVRSTRLGAWSLPLSKAASRRAAGTLLWSTENPSIAASASTGATHGHEEGEDVSVAVQASAVCRLVLFNDPLPTHSDSVPPVCRPGQGRRRPQDR
jgi:hypothetical protein